MSGVSFLCLGLLFFLLLFVGCKAGEKSGGIKLPPAVAKSFIGHYLFLKDSDGSVPKKEARITLKLHGDGTAYLLAVQPGERLESWGRYQVKGNKMDISFYDLGKKADQASYDFDGYNLTLPFLVINDGPGSSQWEKIKYPDNPLHDGQIYLEHLLSKEMGNKEAAQKVISFLKHQKGVNNVYVTDDWQNITIDYGNPRVKFLISSQSRPPSVFNLQGKSEKEHQGKNIFDFLVPKAHAQFLFPDLLLKKASRQDILEKRFLAWLAHEPEPIQLFDAPLTKKAVAITSPFYYHQWQAQEDELKEYDIIDRPYLYGAALYLQDAGYEVDNKGWVNILELRDYIRIFTTDYGVIYWHTHGMWASKNDRDPPTVWLSLGTPSLKIPGDTADDVRNRYILYLREQFEGTGYNHIDFDAHDCFLVDIDTGSLLVSAKFIEKLDNDYSDGLVFLEACHSAHDLSFRKAFNSKAFLGFTDTAYFPGGEMLSHDFFLCLSKKTRTAREAYDFSWGYVKHKTRSGYIGGYEEYTVAVDVTLDRYKLYMKGSDAPQLCGPGGQFEGLSSEVHAMLMQARKFAARDPDRSIEGEIEQLMKCFTEYWFPGNSDALKSPYCHGARVGEPTIEDVRMAQGILGGYKDARTRFTLIE